MSGKREVSTEEAPSAIGPYSQAVETRGTVYTAGQIGLDPVTGEFAGEDVRAQARQVMNNLEAVLAGAGLDLDAVVKTTIFLADMDDFEAVNDVYGDRLEEPYPARSTVEAARLPRGAKVEIEAVACRDGATG